MPISARTCRFSHCSIALALVAVIASSGCASKYGTQTTRVNYYPQCYNPVAELRRDEHSTAKSTAGGAAVGALLGALIGGLASGKASGALAGAAAGGAVGAVGGHMYGKSQQQQRDQQVVANYLRQLDGESAGMDRAAAAGKLAARCYDGAFREAAAAFKAGRMNRMEFAERYEEIRSGMEETSRILYNASEQMARNESEYQRVLAQEERLEHASRDDGGYSRSERDYSGYDQRETSAARPRRSRPKAASGNPVVAKTTQWNNSKQNLDDARLQVNNRMSELEKTASDLMGG